MNVEETIRQLIEQRIAILEDMANAMLSVQRPGWKIVRIQSSEVFGMAFVCDKEDMPPCFKEINPRELKEMIRVVAEEISYEDSTSHR